MDTRKTSVTKPSALRQRENKSPQAWIKHWQMIALLVVIYDFVVCNGAYFLALWLRFDCAFSEIPENYLMSWAKFTPIYSVICFVVFYCLHLYRSMWRFASFSELKRVGIATAITCVLHIVGTLALSMRMPISYYFVGCGIQFACVLGIRFAYRFVILERSKRKRLIRRATANRVMLIGAGSAGQMILRDIQKAEKLNDWVCCIIDDNRNKWGRYIDGVPIVGGREDILLNVEKFKIQKIYMAIPSASATDRRDILNICKETECELKILPGMYQFVAGEIKASAMQEVNIEDLLGREPVKVQMDEIFAFLSGKTILVTGGGGSIGSELCRQIAQHRPKMLIVFDIYENNAYAIQMELQDRYPDLNLEVLVGSVRDSRRLNQVFEKYRPDIVYHAAAHKHVPLMEESPCESIKNNAIGTYKTAYAAMMNGCKRFVLISTDKAVNPTNIMGASKRICEMIVQTFDKKIREGKVHELMPIHRHCDDGDDSVYPVPAADFAPKTDFVAVRFGNVLGSNGSVIPRFKEQIAKGGPVTVTHPDIIRYFMTIPEAASLVLQAGTYANGGEIFVLDMGSPIKIDTLARNLIRLSGLKPDEDIQISYVGLRPGEKLFEEKLMSEEGLRTTPNQMIHIGSPIPFDEDLFLQQLQLLMEAAYNGNEATIRRIVEVVVPTYHPVVEPAAL